jgi:hypothetical protein
MTETIDVHTVGWNNPECCDRRWVDNSYEDDEGHWHSDGDWKDRLLCEIQTIDAKTDYCKRCNKNLRYP